MMNAMLESPISEPMAWKGADLANDRSWIYQLPESALTEIQEAVKNIRARNLPLHQISRSDFLLPSIERELSERLRQIEKGRGFVLIRGVPVDRYPLNELEYIFWGIGTYFGTALSQNAKGELLAHVTDHGEQYGEVNVRGYTTRGAQKFHTDQSDIVALLCVRKAKVGGLSSISSSMAVYNEFLKNRSPEDLKQLYEGFYYDRRGENRPGVAEITESKIPVFSYYSGHLSCRYVYTTIMQASKKMGVSLTSHETAVLDAFNELAARPDMRLDMDLQPGDIQLLNNHTVLHSRSGWEDFEEPDRKRLMIRLWLTPPEPRPLAPIFVNRYGTGERLGVPPLQVVVP
jgi:hypothetical protein